jgi:hypothetical protein
MPLPFTRRFVALAALLLWCGVVAGQQPEPDVTLKVVKYDQLGDVIRQLRGKVIAVDFWADT